MRDTNGDRTKRLTLSESTYSWHGTTFMLARRARRSIFLRISVVSPLTRSVKNELAQPEPYANMLIRLPRSSAGSTEATSDASPP
jgi:hypothetical protein